MRFSRRCDISVIQIFASVCEAKTRRGEAPSLTDLCSAACTLALNGSSRCVPAHAGTQREEPLSASVQAALHKSVSDGASPRLVFASQTDANIWMTEMSQRLEKRIPDRTVRLDF